MNYSVLNDRRNCIMGMYFNLICEEMEITGGKVIHIDKNIGNMDEVH